MTERASTIVSLIPPVLRGDARAVALLQAFEAVLDDMDARDLMLLDPTDVREEALPYLAWEHSLDEFVGGVGVPVETMRDMIAGAWDLHEPKGYAAGILGAIATLGWPATLTQWWQENPKAARGTHSIDVRLDQPLRDGLTAETGSVRAIWRMIHAMQRWSQDHALRLVVEAEVASHVAIGEVIGWELQIEPLTPAMPVVETTSFVGAGLLLGWRLDLVPTTVAALVHAGVPLTHAGQALVSITDLGDQQ